MKTAILASALAVCAPLAYAQTLTETGTDASTEFVEETAATFTVISLDPSTMASAEIATQTYGGEGDEFELTVVNCLPLLSAVVAGGATLESLENRIPNDNVVLEEMTRGSLRHAIAMEACGDA